MYERIEELNVGGMQNYRIYLSECENFIYLRQLNKIFEVGDEELDETIKERKDIDTEKEIYQETIKKLKIQKFGSKMKM